MARRRSGRFPADAEWYVVNTYSGYEAKVKQNMEQRVRSMEATDKVFRIVVPEEEVEESRHGQRRTVKRKMYPGYVLVQMLSLDEAKHAEDAKAKDDADAAWQVVRNTPGVVNFVGADAGSGHKPIPLSPDEASTIFRQMEGEGQRPEVRIQIGERVKIIDGPFTGLLWHGGRGDGRQGAPAGAGFILWTRHAGRAGLPPGREIRRRVDHLTRRLTHHGTTRTGNDHAATGSRASDAGSAGRPCPGWVRREHHRVHQDL